MINDILNKLNKVKSTGKSRWIAECPSHKDKSPSLAIAVDSSGRVLLNCFAGCEAQSVIDAIGAEWSDLFEDENNHTHTKSNKRRIYATEGLELLRFETQIILACGYAMRNGTLTNDDLLRLEKSMERVKQIHEACGL